jgi:hypothetical protein
VSDRVPSLSAFLGAWWLLLLTLWSACATGPRPHVFEQDPPDTEAAVQSVQSDLELAEPGVGPTRPLPVDPQAFANALRRLTRNVTLTGTPRQTALAWLGPMPEEADGASHEGQWLAEVSHGRVLTLVPLDRDAPLSPQAALALRRDYTRWCQSRGGGDCLHLLEDGDFLRAEDRRTLALALALGGVLEETRGALQRELLDPHALLSLLVWTAGMYAMLWLVPEPATKGVAAALTVLLVAWLGVDTFWNLLEGWARLVEQAHAAHDFAQLREAADAYARVLGQDAARALILGVATLTGRTLGELASRVKALPEASQLGARWRLQTQGALEQVETVAAQEALARAVSTVETVAATPGGPLAVVLLKQRGGGSPPGGSPRFTEALRHRGGNRQVVLSNGQRWHLPRGMSPQRIPTADPVGDQLQQAVHQAARDWGAGQFSAAEQRAIDQATRRGKHWLARLLEREARGRFVERKVRNRFDQSLKWNSQGVDVFDPTTGYKYEILSGTQSNLARHGRRMSGEFFRMLTF